MWCGGVCEVFSLNEFASSLAGECVGDVFSPELLIDEVVSGEVAKDPGSFASWAQWATSVTGGWVCNRVVYWNGTQWMQAPSLEDSSIAVPWDGVS